MAYDSIFLKDSTSQMMEICLRDSTSGQSKTGLTYSDVTGYYIREGSNSNTPITLSNGTLGVYASGSFVEVGQGLYQFSIPNSCLASGVNAVTFIFKANGTIDKAIRVLLFDVNVHNAVDFGLSNLDKQISTLNDLSNSDVSGIVQNIITAEDLLNFSDLTSELTNLDIAISSSDTSAIMDSIINHASFQDILSFVKGKMLLDTSSRTMTFYDPADSTTAKFTYTYSIDRKTRTVS